MPFDGSQLDDVTKLLIEGRERIEQGWCQGRFEENSGAVCMMGAIGWKSKNAGMPVSVTSWYAYERLEAAIGAARLPQWNDDYERTKDEILAAFDRAIANG